MKLQVPFIQLPLAFDASVIAEEISALGDTPWRPHPQGFPGNSMLPLVAVDGDPANEEFSGPMRPTSELLRCPYLTQTLASLGATVGRTRLMRLSGNAEVKRHADQGYYWAERVRVHVPIVTQPTVRFECDGAIVNMAAGECWIFDTWRLHSVVNDATLPRIHLVADTVGGDAFWRLVAGGRPHHLSPPGWLPRKILPRVDEVAEFPCESVNVPAVMSPWELNSHMAMLFSDAHPHPNLAKVRHVALHFTRAWQGLWFQHGDAESGRASFRATLEAFLDEIREVAQPLMLKNDLHWYGALTKIVGQAAVADEPSTVISEARKDVGDNG